MSLHLPTAELGAEPGWPQGDHQSVIVLTDPASRLEKDLARSWVARRQPQGVSVEIIGIPPSRRHKPYHRLDERLGARLEHQDNPLILPLRVVWMPQVRDGRRSLSWRDFLSLRDPRDPDVISQHVILRMHPDRVRILAGAGATVGELRAAWIESVETTTFADFVARRGRLALERAEREVRGARYKIPKLVRQEILRRGDFRDGLAQLAPVVDRPVEQMYKKSRRYLKEMAASHSPFVIDLVASAIRLLYQQGYGSIRYDDAQFKELYTLGTQYPLVFLPSHKSNLDHLVLQYLLWENDLPPNHTAGGVNMNFFPVGPIIRRSGVFFIKRSFKDNPTYKFVLRSYIDYLIEKRFPLEWYIEGGRSRTGKLAAPRFGLLTYVADSLAAGKSDDVYLIPTSISYDHIQEVAAYAAEQRGLGKEKEGFAWLIKSVRGLRKRYGNIHLRFGEPLSLRKEIDPALTGDARHLAIQKVAFEVCVRINRVTPITPTSLVTVALLSAGDVALSHDRLAALLGDLVDQAEARKLPSTEPLAMLRTEKGIADVTQLLAEHGILDIHVAGSETVYQIVHDQHLAGAFYRNTIIHFFLTAAIAELGLLAASSQRSGASEAFWGEVRALRDLLKFEFFFPERAEFEEEVHQELSHWDEGWLERVEAGAADSVLDEIRPHRGPWVLRSFLEAYLVVAEELADRPIDQPWDEKAFLRASLDRGTQYLALRKLRAGEAVSQSLFKTAVQLADNRDLLEPGSDDLGRQRQAFAAEMRRILALLDRLAGDRDELRT